MEQYAFRCSKCHHHFEAASNIPPSYINLLLGVLTLGLWLFFLSLYQLFRLYHLSKCPNCRHRSFLLLFFFLILVIFTLELGREIYYFVEVAPIKIVQHASMTELPENMDINDSVNKENVSEVFSFLWIVGIMPTVGAYFSQYWPYILVLWLGFVTIVAFLIPSFYRKRSESI